MENVYSIQQISPPGKSNQQDKMNWFKTNTDNHADIHVNKGRNVFSLLKKICDKILFPTPPQYPKTFTALNYRGIIRIKINGIFV